MLKAVACETKTDGPVVAVTVKEAAKILGCSEGLIWKLTREGQLKSRRFGKRFTRWIKSEVEDFLVNGGVSGK